MLKHLFWRQLVWFYHDECGSKARKSPVKIVSKVFLSTKWRIDCNHLCNCLLSKLKHHQQSNKSRTRLLSLHVVPLTQFPSPSASYSNSLGHHFQFRNNDENKIRDHISLNRNGSMVHSGLSNGSLMAFNFQRKLERDSEVEH